MRSLIKLNLGVASISAVTTAQKHAAVYLFGSKGEAIAKRLDEMARAKELIAPHVAGLLKFLKEAPDDDIIAFKTSASGKKTIAAAKAFASAKTLVTSINSLRQIKVAGEWLEAPQGSTAPAETKTHRASKKATGKGAAPVVVENPQAPAAVAQPAQLDVLSKVYDWTKFDPRSAGTWTSLSKAFNEVFKGRFSSKFVKSEGALRVTILERGYRTIPTFHIGVAPEEKSWFMYALSPTDDGVDGRFTGPKLTLASVLSVLTDLMAQTNASVIASNKAEIAGAVVYADARASIKPENVAFDKEMARLEAEAKSPKAINSLAKMTSRNLGKITPSMSSMIRSEMKELLRDTDLGAISFHGETPYAGLPQYVFDVLMIGKYDNLAGVALVPPQKGSTNWSMAGILMGRESVTKMYDLGPKLTAAKVNAALPKIAKAAAKK